MGEFTPGPWRNAGRYEAPLPNNDYPAFAIYDNRGPAGHFIGWVDAQCDESDANARLIAQAPELYAALRRLLATISKTDSMRHGPECNCVIHDAERVLRAVEGQ